MVKVKMVKVILAVWIYSLDFDDDGDDGEDDEDDDDYGNLFSGKLSLRWRWWAQEQQGQETKKINFQQPMNRLS